MLIAVARSSETGLTTMQAVICFADLANRHTRAGTVGQFNSGNRIGAALRFPYQGIVGLPPWSDQHADTTASFLHGVRTSSPRLRSYIQSL